MATFNFCDQEVFEDKVVKTGTKEAPDGIFRRGDSWLFRHMKRGFDQAGRAGRALKSLEQLPQSRVLLTSQRLNASRSVHMACADDLIAIRILHRERKCHIRRILLLAQLENAGGLVLENDRSEWP